VKGWWSFSGRVVAVAGDEDFVLRADQAGTATRPLRVQTGQAHLVEPVDDTPDRVFITLDQTGDGRDGVPAGRSHDHHRSP
jgi:hypothetical protein